MRLIPSLIFLVVAFTAYSALAQNLRSGGVLKPEQAIMDIRHYSIALDVNIEQQSIDGTTEIDLVTSQPTQVLLFDLVHLLTVKKVWVDKKEQPFTQADDLVRIALATALKPGAVKVKIQYGGKPGLAERAPWIGGFQWAKDSLGNPWVAITCQSEGAKIYYPCKDHPSDEPNEGADLKITVPKGLYVAGPGLLKDVSTKGNKSTYHWATTYTINNYSILFNIGKYKVFTRTFTSVSGKQLPMQVYLLEEHAHRAPALLDIFERSARVHEKYFGEYPWIREKIAVCETPHLGMEHQTLNAYGNKFRYVDVGGKKSDWLLHHELGHEWWGNKVTGIDWADMWIQEGICTFGDHLYTREYEGEEGYQKRMQQTARSTQNQKAVVQGKDLDTDVVYHGDIYGKGAFFMHTIRYVTGDEIFFPTLKKLATDPAYTYDHLVNTDDVEKLFSTASGKDLNPLFDFFLRTTHKLDISVRQTGDTKYLIRLANFTASLPMDVVTDAGKQKMMITPEGITVNSKTVPVPDPDVFYLKRVILE